MDAWKTNGLGGPLNLNVFTLGRVRWRQGRIYVLYGLSFIFIGLELTVNRAVLAYRVDLQSNTFDMSICSKPSPPERTELTILFTGPLLSISLAKVDNIKFELYFASSCLSILPSPR